MPGLCLSPSAPCLELLNTRRASGPTAPHPRGGLSGRSGAPAGAERCRAVPSARTHGNSTLSERGILFLIKLYQQGVSEAIIWH